MKIVCLAGPGTPEASDSPRTLERGAVLPGSGQHILGSKLPQSKSHGHTAGPRKKKCGRHRDQQHAAHRDHPHTKLTPQNGKFKIFSL